MAMVHAKCIAHAFDSKNAIQYWPGLEYDLDLSNNDQWKLVWLRTPRGKWIFDFDRAGSSDTNLRRFFCKQCGQPFDRLNEIGTHDRQYHNKNDEAAKIAKAENDADEEARLLSERIAEEEKEKPKTIAERFIEQSRQRGAAQ